MAIYHFTVNVIGRGHGRSAVAAVNRSAGELHDQRQDQSFDYSDKPMWCIPSSSCPRVQPPA